MTEENIRTNLAPNGLRVVTERIPGFHSVALGIFFRQGSRDEEPSTRGSRHLVEHMLFKGSSKRSGKETLAAIEQLGGITDGFTSKEITGITLRCLSDSLEPLLTILFEMLSEPRFDEKELRKEKQVIYEEMRSSQEDPHDQVFDRFFQACFSPHPLARPVVGRKSTVAKITRGEILDIYRRNYTLADCTLVAVGDVNQERLGRILPDKVGLGKGRRKTRPLPRPKQSPSRRVHTRADLSQVHAVMGTQTPGINSEDRFPLALLATLMGGGMSSRLFSVLREDKGLVYAVSSFLELFEDSGITGFYFVTEKRKLGKVFSALQAELKRLIREGLSTGELSTAKTLTKSALLLSMESLSHRMMRLGYWKLLAKKFRTISQTIEAFEKVSRDQVLAAAAQLYDSRPFHTSLVGPVRRGEIKSFSRR